ncbi:MAG: hypothetical protein RIQ60_4179 [Pseudomonadota bacterium]
MTESLSLSQMDLWERAIRVELRRSEEKFWETHCSASTHTRWFSSWFDLCSGDGRTRESALLRVGPSAPSAFFLALALRRLNDWVPQVRRAAREALPDLAVNSEPGKVAEVLWTLLCHWTSWGRMDVQDRQTVAAIASQDAVSRALKSKIMGTTAGPAALVFAQCARSAVFDAWLFEFASHAVQPAVRARAFRWLLSGQVTWVVGYKWRWINLAYLEGTVEAITESRSISVTHPFLMLLDAASADRSPLVRRIAAEFLIRELATLGETARPMAQRCSSDRSRSVAERGAFALQRLQASLPIVNAINPEA